VSERSLTSNTVPSRKDAAIETREKILRAAIATVRAHGIAGATTRAIAAEAGIAEGSIYRHFRDKIDVFQTAVVEYLVPSYRDFMGDLPAKAGTATPAVRLREVLRKTMAFYRDLIPTMAVLYSENALRDRYQAQLIEGRGPHRASEAVAEYLAGELSLGRLPSGIDPQAAAQMLLGACFQQVFFEQTIGKERLQLSERALIARMVQTLTGRGGAPTSE
jgi:AcrR family transcriptional regulator